MGIIAETFRNWPEAYRSDHPARSVTAVGKYAAHLTEKHDLENIFGIDSPGRCKGKVSFQTYRQS